MGNDWWVKSVLHTLVAGVLLFCCPHQFAINIIWKRFQRTQRVYFPYKFYRSNHHRSFVVILEISGNANRYAVMVKYKLYHYMSKSLFIKPQ